MHPSLWCAHTHTHTLTHTHTHTHTHPHTHTHTQPYPIQVLCEHTRREPGRMQPLPTVSGWSVKSWNRVSEIYSFTLRLLGGLHDFVDYLCLSTTIRHYSDSEHWLWKLTKIPKMFEGLQSWFLSALRNVTEVYSAVFRSGLWNKTIRRTINRY